MRELINPLWHTMPFHASLAWANSSSDKIPKRVVRKMVVEGANVQLEMSMKEGFVALMVWRNLKLESAPRFCASFMYVLTPFLIS